MAPYAWVIDTDHLADPGVKGEAGTVGPRNAPDALVALLKGETSYQHGAVRFRMYDDDDELYYTGRLITTGDDDEEFAPLDDFGAPNAGCTRIDYRGQNGTWTQI